jgi:hypothetical protein
MNNFRRDESKIHRDIFRAIHEGRWLAIYYCNIDDEFKDFWIGINDLDASGEKLRVDGIQPSMTKPKAIEYEHPISIKKILSTEVIEGTFHPVNSELIDDIAANPAKYSLIFKDTANMKILSYLEHCNKIDQKLYETNYIEIPGLNKITTDENECTLSDEQIEVVLEQFKNNLTKNNHFQKMCINKLSVKGNKGLSVLVYKEIFFDIKNQKMKITASLKRNKFIINLFLDDEDYYLFDDFDKNEQEIKDKIDIAKSDANNVLDDTPHIICIRNKYDAGLAREYPAIEAMFNTKNITAPIEAFFGKLVKPQKSPLVFPLALIDNKIDPDQLRAVYRAMNYSVSFVQGPPGTGKTSTILNTIMSAFFNEQTVLISSNNNTPINDIFNNLLKLEYNGKPIRFPIIRIGNKKDVTPATIERIYKFYKQTENLPPFNETRAKEIRENKTEKANKLSEFLERYEEFMRLEELKTTMESELENNNSPLAEYFLPIVNKRLLEIGDADLKTPLKSLTEDVEDFKEYLYCICEKYLRRLHEPKYKDLVNILNIDDEKTRVNEFTDYIKNNETFNKLLEIFPVMVATCLSANKLGAPKPHFDITIIDEASQCNTATSLIPVIRGKKLMLVGDPRQLEPIINIDDNVNHVLLEKYAVPHEYDYKHNSIFETFLKNSAFNDYILLRYHYRCHEKIISFSNKKYYDGKLIIKTQSLVSEKPLDYIIVDGEQGKSRNTAPSEVEQIVQFICENNNKNIGIITPFRNQQADIKNAIKELADKGIIKQEKSDSDSADDVICVSGTVHTFQGKQTDVILFSLALSDNTSPGSYRWLKNNLRLINVATTRPREKLILLFSQKAIDRLSNKQDDIYELVNYVKNDGAYEINSARTLTLKPLNTKSEDKFMKILKRALKRVTKNNPSYSIEPKMGLKDVYDVEKSRDVKDKIITNEEYDYILKAHLDFVIYKKDNENEMPVLAFEHDDNTHIKNEKTKARDRFKDKICNEQGLKLCRIRNFKETGNLKSDEEIEAEVEEMLINFFKL